MKALTTTMSLALIFSSTIALARPAKQFTLTCQSQHASLHVEFTSSQADGVAIDLIRYQGKTVGSDAMTDTGSDINAIPSRLVFFARKRLVALVTKKDFVESALQETSEATIVVDGRAEPATCR